MSGAAAGNSEVEGSQPATEDADDEGFLEVSDIVAEVVIGFRARQRSS